MGLSIVQECNKGIRDWCSSIILQWKDKLGREMLIMLVTMMNMRVIWLRGIMWMEVWRDMIRRGWKQANHVGSQRKNISHIIQTCTHMKLTMKCKTKMTFYTKSITKSSRRNPMKEFTDTIITPLQIKIMITEVILSPQDLLLRKQLKNQEWWCITCKKYKHKIRIERKGKLI